MAEKHFITGPREKKRRLGILALSGAEENRAGNCPKPEEMAELLDGTCDRSTREKLFLHLDSCESCFQEWLELTSVLKAEKKLKHTVVSIFSRKRVLAAAGSALAVAASIVVFMSTPFYKDSTPLHYQVLKKQTEEMSAPDSVFQETADQKDKEIDTSISADKEEAAMEQQEMPVSLPSKRTVSPAEEKKGVYRLRKSSDKDDAGQQALKPVLEAAPQAPAPERANEQLQDRSTQVIGSLGGADSSTLDEYKVFIAFAERFCSGDSVDVNPKVLLTKARELQKKKALNDRQRQVVIEKVVKLMEEDVPHPVVCERLALILCFDGGPGCGEKINSTQIKNSNRE